MAVLIDTCVWIDVATGALTDAQVAAVTGDDDALLSPVTIAELKLGAEIAPDPATRQRRLAELKRLLAVPCLTIDAVTGEIFGDLAAVLRQSGRGHRRRVQDLWLAASAVQHGHRLLTRNGDDFADVPGLQLLVV